jgi:hypothetical protein
MSESEVDDAPSYAATALAISRSSKGKTTRDDLEKLATSNRITGAMVGTLVGITSEHAPMVIFPGQQNTGAITARSTIDLHGGHIGRTVIMMFEGGNPDLPIVLGCLQDTKEDLTSQVPGQFEVECDGERSLVTAKEQLVLRCGTASITLTKSGKVLIQGAYISTRSSGVIRIKGGAVQLN